MKIKMRKRGIAILCAVAMIIGLAQGHVSKVEATPIRKLTELTIGDFGMTSGTYSSDVTGPLTTLTNIADTEITMTIKLPKTGFSIRCGEKSKGNWTGYRFDMVGDGQIGFGYVTYPTTIGVPNEKYVNVDILNPDVAGVALCDNEIELKITTEIIDADKDGYQDDVKTGLYFNDMLYKSASQAENDYHYIFIDHAKELGNYLSFYDADANTADQIKISEPLTELNMMDFVGLTPGAHPAVSGGLGNGQTIADAKMTMNINIPKTGICIRYGEKVRDGWTGIRLDPAGNGQLGFGFVTLTELDKENTITTDFLDSQIAGVELCENDIELKITTEVVDWDLDNAADDVKIGLYFDGKLYGQKYYYFVDCASFLGNRFAIYDANPDAIDFVSLDLPQITIADFETGEILPSTESYRGRLIGRQSVANTCFNADVIFPVTTEVSVRYGGNSEWDGIRLDPNPIGGLSFGFFENSTTNFYEELSSDVAGVDLCGTKYNLKIRVEVVEFDTDGADDLRVGLFFNDVLYDNRYFYMPDFAQHLGDQIMFNTNGHPDKGFSIKQPTEEIVRGDFEGSDTYKVVGEYGATIDGKTYEKGSTFSECGVHTVAFSSNGHLYRKNLIIYKYGDATLDGAISANDIVALKRNVADAKERPFDEAAIKGADMDLSNAISGTDIERLRDHMLMGTAEYQFTELDNHVRYLGRTTPTKNGVGCDFTASGFEFSAYMEGEVSLTFTTSASSSALDVYLTVFIDDARQAERLCVAPTSTGTVTIANFDKPGIHKVRVLRQTEAQFALGELNALKFKGYFQEKPKEREHYIEIIGDSLTCGYGNVRMEPQAKECRCMKMEP